MLTLQRFMLACVATATLSLAACGGGGGDGEPATVADTRQVPASALASATAYSEWAASLPRQEGGEPVSVEGVVAPTSDTAEPIGLS